MSALALQSGRHALSDTESDDPTGRTLLVSRRCRACRRWQALDGTNFCSCSSSRDQQRRVYFSRRCRACDAASSRQRWRSDPTAKARDKASRDLRREEIRAYDRLRAKRDREKRSEKVKRWLLANPERAKELGRARAARRRGRQLAAGKGWTANEFARVVLGQRGKCWWCNGSLKRTGCHADHRIALALGGSDDISNIVASCPSCNRAKSAKTPWEFAGRLL